MHLPSASSRFFPLRFREQSFCPHLIDHLYGNDFVLVLAPRCNIPRDDLLLRFISLLVLLQLLDLPVISNHILLSLLLPDQHVEVLAEGVVVGDHGILLEKDTKVAGTIVNVLLFVFELLDASFQFQDETLSQTSP